MMGILKGIAAWLYGIGVGFRNWLYDMNILRSHQMDIPTICVGNLAVGGTGKTPVVEFLVRNLSREYCVAVLSRGYRRRTKGYIEVQVGDSYRKVGDEPKQIKRKFPEAVVVVCENRIEGVRRIKEEHPEVGLVIMDDGFQHRSLSPSVSMLLSDYSLPPYHNKMLPAGTLRDSPSQLYRASVLIITKTPKNLSPLDRELARKELNPSPYQSVFYTDIKQCEPTPIFSDVAPARIPEGCKVIAFAGIANPDRFFDSLSQRYTVVDKIVFGDHHNYKVRDIRKIMESLELYGKNIVVVTTEKDGVKLTSRKYIPERLQRRLFVLPIEINFRDGDSDKLIQKIKNELKDKKI